ncbi:MAG: hypothetical protein AAGE43_01290 [Pseudomonadota bacterium]
MSRPFVILSLLLASTGTAANPTNCSFGELSRNIEVVYANPGQAVPCEVIYDKASEGSIETLWQANVEAGYCESQAAGLIAKLEGLGWRCTAAAQGAPSDLDSAVEGAMDPEPRSP